MTHDLGEESTHFGTEFGQLHGGYFSNPDVAKPLLDAAVDAWYESQAGGVVDLGGGTGFLLSQLKARGLTPEPAYVNLDGSSAQLEVAQTGGIPTVCGSVESFSRVDVVPPGEKALFLMRSVLHYFGEAGLMPVLRHLRSQSRAGEIWIHQTACFEQAEDAACLSDVYQRIHTGKWYTTVADLQARLSEAGWSVEECRPAPTLCLESADLGARYGVGAEELRRIRETVAAEFGEQSPVFRLTPEGFQADLRYHIFVCRASL